MSEPALSFGDLLVQLFAALAKHRVEYAVFGAVALAFHGLPRATGDLDLWLAPSRENIENALAALQEVYADPALAEVLPEELLGDYPAVRYGPPVGFPLDLVTRLGSLGYPTLEVEVAVWRGVPVRVVSARTLWPLKRESPRPQDRLDAAALARLAGIKEPDADR